MGTRVAWAGLRVGHVGGASRASRPSVVRERSEADLHQTNKGKLI